MKQASMYGNERNEESEHVWQLPQPLQETQRSAQPQKTLFLGHAPSKKNGLQGSSN